MMIELNFLRALRFCLKFEVLKFGTVEWIQFVWENDCIVLGLDWMKDISFEIDEITNICDILAYY